MKKSIIFSIVIVVILAAIVASAFGITGYLISEKAISCTDTDVTEEYSTGINYYEKGIVTLTFESSEREYIDRCDGSRRVKEYYCVGNKMRTKTPVCGDKCVDGVCID